MAMDKIITIQVHDYDKFGNYRIIENKNTTLAEAQELRKKAIASIGRVDWDKLPKECMHVVYYAELDNSTQGVWFAGIFMHGKAYTDRDFEDIFCKPNVSYVGAFHRLV